MARAWGQNLAWGPGVAATFGDFPSRLIDGLTAPRDTAPAVVSPKYVSLDLGQTLAIDCVALINSTIYEQAVVVTAEVQGSVDDVFTSPVTLKAASTLRQSTHRRYSHALCFPQASYRYVRIKLVFSGAVTLRIGEVLVSKLTALSRATPLGQRDLVAYAMNRSRTMAGEERPIALSGPYVTSSVGVAEPSNAEREALRDVFRAALAGARPLLYVPRHVSSAAAALPSEQECLLGRLQESENNAVSAAPDRNVVDGLSLRSLTRGML